MGIGANYVESLMEAKFQRDAVVRLVERSNTYVDVDTLRVILNIPDAREQEMIDAVKQCAIEAIERILAEEGAK